MSEKTSVIETYPIWRFARKQLICCDEYSKDHFASGAVWGHATTMLALSHAWRELGLDPITKIELDKMIDERITQEEKLNETYVNN